MTDIDKLLTRAESHIAFLNREPQDWWHDEHCLDNGQSAVLIDRLAAALRGMTIVVQTAAGQFDEAMSLLSEARNYVPEFTGPAEEIDETLPAMQEALKALKALAADPAPVGDPS